jgi:hypothetical protein
MLGWLYFVAIELSIVSSGTFYNHYMLQVLPPLLLLAALGLSGRDWDWTRWTPRLLAAGVAGGAIWFGALGMLCAADQLRGAVDRPLERAADAIRADMHPNDGIWAVGRTHLILFYLNKDPVVPVAAFPSNLTNPAIIGPLTKAGLMPEGGAHAALALGPRYVVTSAEGPPSQLNEVDQARFTALYELWRSENGVFVYRSAEESDR